MKEDFKRWMDKEVSNLPKGLIIAKSNEHFVVHTGNGNKVTRKFHPLLNQKLKEKFTEIRFIYEKTTNFNSFFEVSYTVEYDTDKGAGFIIINVDTKNGLQLKTHFIAPNKEIHDEIEKEIIKQIKNLPEYRLLVVTGK